MISRTTSVAGLGAAAVVIGMLLARPARGDDGAASRQPNHALLAARVGTAVGALPPPAGASAAVTRLVVAADCPASHTVVRVLLRRAMQQVPVPPLVILTDRPWPTLDSLRALTASPLQLVPRLPHRVGITPVAFTPHRSTGTRSDSTSVGVPQVLAHLAPLPLDPP